MSGPAFSPRAGLDPKRFCLWVYAHAGLAAAWEIEDGHDPVRSFSVIDIVEARLLGNRPQ